LTRQKGFDLLIRAYKHASASLPSSRLVIIGEGEQHEDLRHLIASQDLVDRVVLAGPRSDARLLLGVGDVFVMSSRWEGLPLVLLEAMAAGLPVISTNVGDVSTVTGRSSALLVEPEDVEGLAAAMSEMGMDADLRRQLSAASLASVEPYTDLEAFVTELEDVYLRALAKEN
jgi:glycosyltransferase involved in cell wall biosynthesis